MHRDRVSDRTSAETHAGDRLCNPMQFEDQELECERSCCCARFQLLNFVKELTVLSLMTLLTSCLY